MDVQNKLYNGKELDRMHVLSLYDYSARQYDAALGQFTSMDPLCEKYYHISPYAYCAGNPVKYVDPNGRYVTLSGVNSDDMLEYLQELVGDAAILLQKKGGILTYQRQYDSDGNEIAASEDANFILSVIDNTDVNVIMERNQSYVPQQT